MKKNENKYLKTINFLKKYEGFKDTVYLDGKGIPTIGYGFTDPDLIAKGYISRADADRRLIKEIQNREKKLRDTIKGWDNLSDDSKTALLSYHFNYPAGFKDTTKFIQYWNAGDYSSAIKEVNAGMNDKKNKGLRNRRLEEQALLMSDPYLNQQNVPEKYKPREWKRPAEIPVNIPKVLSPTQYPLDPKDRLPISIDSWSGADSPAYGGKNVYLPDVQKVNNQRKEKIEDALDKSLLNIDYSPTYTKFEIPKANCGKDRKPRFDEGTPYAVGPYNVYPSAVAELQKGEDALLNATWNGPDIPIIGTDRRPLYQRYDAENSVYDGNAIRNITDWVPGIGDVSAALDAVDAFNNGNYLQAGILGGGLIVPKFIGKAAKPIVENIPTDQIKRITDNFIKFADKHRGKVIRTAKGPDYNQFMRRFGHLLDKDRVSVDDIYSAMRGRGKELKSIKKGHSEYNGEGLIDYIEDGKPVGDITVYEDPAGWNRINVGSIVSNKPGVGRKLYDSAIEVAKLEGFNGVVSGIDLLSAPKTYSTWKHYPNKKLIGNSGMHSNEGMLDELENITDYKKITNGPIYQLEQPSQYVPVKHTKMFDPRILTSLGKMRIDLKDPSMFRAIGPIAAGTALGWQASELDKEDYDNMLSRLRTLVDGLGMYANGKDVYIKPSKRGTFTAAAKKRGKSVQAFASLVLSNPGKYSKAMRKKALFAKNASKWSH